MKIMDFMVINDFDKDEDALQISEDSPLSLLILSHLVQADQEGNPFASPDTKMMQELLKRMIRGKKFRITVEEVSDA